MVEVFLEIAAVLKKTGATQANRISWEGCSVYYKVSESFFQTSEKLQVFPAAVTW